MQLKDVVMCECGGKMFPTKVDKKKREINYRCSVCECGKEVKRKYEEVALRDNENQEYFSLDDEGNITWKCYTHGYCEMDIDWLNCDWQMKVAQFMESGCGLDIVTDEMEDAFEEADIETLETKFSELSEEQLEQLSELMNISDEWDLGYVDSFFNAFMDRVSCGEIDSWDDFISEIDDNLADMDDGDEDE